jgi:hypothetical protein
VTAEASDDMLRVACHRAAHPRAPWRFSGAAASTLAAEVTVRPREGDKMA